MKYTMPSWGEPLTEKQSEQVKALAFACPLEAGNAVYCARTVLRTMGSYLFDDTAICGTAATPAAAPNTKRKNTNAEATVPKAIAEWRVYPNPATDWCLIRWQGEDLPEQWELEVYDIQGQCLQLQQVKGPEIILPTQDLPSGVYWLKAKAAGQLVTHRIIIH